MGTSTVEVSGVSKFFRGNAAVSDVSFCVQRGEILGMLGPNGAGKTTTIRMMMDIIKPDRGEIRVFGETAKEGIKDRVGYLPEERGLYRKISVIESLVYLAALKGVKANLARDRATRLLERADMLQHKDKKIQELSRGMGQIIQSIATILHDPELVVLDEPFSGLDPINTELLKEFILELRDQGKAVILSTHMMNQIEELCDRALMINKGRIVLYGSLDEIKSKFRNNSVLLKCDTSPGEIPGVVDTRMRGKSLELFLDGRVSPQELLSILVDRGIGVERFEVSTPSLNEIFIQVVKEER